MQLLLLSAHLVLRALVSLEQWLVSSQCCSQAAWIPGYQHQFLVVFLKKCHEEDQEKVKMELKAGGHPVWAACLILQDMGLNHQGPKLRRVLGMEIVCKKPKHVRLTDSASAFSLKERDPHSINIRKSTLGFSISKPDFCYFFHPIFAILADFY